MRVISLNTHSWMEKDPLVKLKQIGDFILANEIDKIALQEVNQKISSPEITNLNLFCKNNNNDKIREDNYARLLVDYLKEQGVTYYWSWTCSHIGYDIYEEGSAILSKTPFKAESLLVSSQNDKKDYRTRQILFAHFEEEEMHLASCHFSWWDKDKETGFYYEWHEMLKRIKKSKEQMLLLGDFNTPAHIKKEGYDLVTETLYDTYELATRRNGSFTVDEEIDGWKDNQEKLRIDFAFSSKRKEVSSYQVIFNGDNGPVVSDHFGIMIEID